AGHAAVARFQPASSVIDSAILCVGIASAAGATPISAHPKVPAWHFTSCDGVVPLLTTVVAVVVTVPVPFGFVVVAVVDVVFFACEQVMAWPPEITRQL